jgi:glyoxylase-like metal-dependent hydrolase (beta-lactamase superfamily II)
MNTRRGQAKGSDGMAQDWFTTRELGHDIWVLQDPIGRVAPGFNVSVVNLYLVIGRERAALIDSGMGLSDIREAYAALTDLPIVNLCSHSHWDHVSGSYLFAERLIHPLERHRLDEDYKVEGVTQFRAAPATGAATEGTVIDLGGRTLTVWHTPGHSPGHVSYRDSATGYLFCADTCYAGTLWMQTEDANLAQWRASLERIAASDVTALLGGHEESVQPRTLASDVLAALDVALDGRSESELFDFDPGTRKHRFGRFNILLRE